MTQEPATPDRRIAARRSGDAMRAVWAGDGGVDMHDPGMQAAVLRALDALREGDFSVRLPAEWPGIDGKIAEALNDIALGQEKLAAEIERVSNTVGIEGKLGSRLVFDKVGGAWGREVRSINSMLDNLVQPVREAGRVIGAVARGALNETMQLDFDGRPLKGEFVKNANTINAMLSQLNSFAGEVTRVAREVGTEGKLGGQAQVTGVSGVWKELADSVNLMANNLTDQVRGIAKVVTYVAEGKLNKRMMLPARGEVAALAETINDMVDKLATFSEQVTRVAREVGVEGRLGGQALVPGASGNWKDLVDSVNELAANLSTQVRAIGEVATAVTKGDLECSIQVVARGEVADLKDKLNQMIRKLRETTEHNTEQDWLKTNLARLTRMLQGQRDIVNVSRLLLSELAPLVGALHGVLYMMQAPRKGEAGPSRLRLVASYGYQERKNLSSEWAVGEGLVGQAAFERKRFLIGNVPDDYVQIVSGLGQSAPRNIVVLPILLEDEVKAVIELAGFEPFRAIHLSFLDQLAQGLGIVFNAIETAVGTETLLRRQAEQLEGEFQSQQSQLQESNAELERKAHELADQNAEVERKNREIEEARSSLQEKAEQLSLTSKYKSEFLANMSHELRSPLNSLLLLAEQMSQNREQNLNDKQLDMVRIMYASGRDLLHLINDILDLSKIEAGGVTLEIADVDVRKVADELDNSFRYQAATRGLAFTIEFSSELPAVLRTDGQRVKQVLTNLLSNAFKFTSKGKVTLSARPATSGWSPDNATLANAPLVVAFSVTDTGIGIAPDKKKLIFEAFQQADASTSRRYGGTGLGLAISREIARLLGGELDVESIEGKGSTFTFYLPQQLQGEPAAASVVSPAVRAAAWATEPQAPPEAAGGARPLLLIIEDDPVFARTLKDLATERGFNTLVGASGEEGSRLAQRFRPDAITLDLGLPDVDGWVIADRLQADPGTRSIPVHVISIRDRPQAAAAHGVASYTTKPADLATLGQVFSEITVHATARPLRTLLLIENDLAKRDAIIKALAREDSVFDAVSSAADALAALRSRPYHGIVIEFDQPGIDGMALLKEIRSDAALAAIPAVLYSERQLDPATARQVGELDAGVIGDNGSAVGEVTAGVTTFLERVKLALPESRTGGAAAVPVGDVLRGRCVLIVDDDARNLFALTGLLEGRDMKVIAAETGQEAIRQLNSTPGIEIVLMDIMMPDMDGYETMRRLRADPRFARLPIIALTAKAMLEDRTRCLAAGASDYASKPVDSEQLLGQLAVWLAEKTVAGTA
ncbi:response regulator [Massilia cavernae]|uniref:Virulence sensor protein BvgS n=1 Tax=Massilia cavernae TaxID=2320864 RepID=A0A418XXS5_9BURK|nr:response regulator [Massilia cavernae]RJG17743.1 response regulator [Massilia cavernae]